MLNNPCPTLSFRRAKSEIIIKVSENDSTIRKFLELLLERTKIDLLTMSWTIVHPIDQDSPLFGFTRDDLDQSGFAFDIKVSIVKFVPPEVLHLRTW